MVEICSSLIPELCRYSYEERVYYYEADDYGSSGDGERDGPPEIEEEPTENSGSGGIVPDRYIINFITTEQKLQHFLNNTVRKGSTYKFGGKPWHWDNEHYKWAVDENKYGCQGLTTCFLAFWFNFNQFFPKLWNGFHDFEAFDRYTSDYGVKEFVDEKIALTYKELIAGRYLKKVNHLDPEAEPEDNWYEFEADGLNDVNVFNENGHHWGLYIKRGAYSTDQRPDSEADKQQPGRDGGRNYIWRLAADGIFVQNYDDSGLDKESVAGSVETFMQAADRAASGLDQVSDSVKRRLQSINGTCGRWKGYVSSFGVSNSWEGPDMRKFPDAVSQGIDELGSIGSQDLTQSQRAEKILKAVRGIDKVHVWTVERKSSGSLRMWTNEPTTWRYMTKNLKAGSPACSENVYIWKLKDVLPIGWTPPCNNPLFLLNTPALIGQ